MIDHIRRVEVVLPQYKQVTEQMFAERVGPETLGATGRAWGGLTPVPLAPALHRWPMRRPLDSPHDHRCPYCGSERVARLADLAWLLALIGRRLYLCRDCRRRFLDRPSR